MICGILYVRVLHIIHFTLFMGFIPTSIAVTPVHPAVESGRAESNCVVYVCALWLQYNHKRLPVQVKEKCLKIMAQV